MAEQRRIGFRWNLRTIMAQRNLWKTTELMPLLEVIGGFIRWQHQRRMNQMDQVPKAPSCAASRRSPSRSIS